MKRFRLLPVVPLNLYQPINQREGLAQDIGQIISDMPAENIPDYEDILARLNSLPASSSIKPSR